MKRIVAPAKYKWDFTNLYKNQVAWKKDLQLLVEKAEHYQSFRGKLHEKTQFLKYLDFDQEIDLLTNKLSIYLSLGDVDTSDQTFQELSGLLTNEYQKIRVMTSFLAPEIKKVGEAQVLAWIRDDTHYAKYSYHLTTFFREASHVLEDDYENLLSKVSRSRSFASSLYDTLAYADRHEELIDYHGQQQPLTTSLMMEIAEDSDPLADQQLRKKAARLFTKNFTDRKHSFASMYEGILVATAENLTIRHYESSLSASLLDDAVPVAIYLKLLEVGKQHSGLFRDYNLFLKKHFGLEKFYPSDGQLKLVKEFQKQYTVEEGQAIITKALNVLGSEYLAKLTVAWSDNHIDFYEDTNKRDGAYSTSAYGFAPIILMNWDDKLNSVNTLAHESGHSVHTLFAESAQPYPLNEYPIILAEVASTINEHLLFDYLYQQAETKSEKIYLLQQRIFDILATFTRQIQFAAFEYEAHTLVEQNQPLTADILGNLFRKLQNDYGYDVFDNDSTPTQPFYGWPRISHFFHSPFYVYKYAIDIVASFKLYDDIKKGNVQTTLDFLKAGGHKDPLLILQDAGVDFNDETTYLPLINSVRNYLQELEKLLAQ